jgi:hypothetical protein
LGVGSGELVGGVVHHVEYDPVEDDAVMEDMDASSSLSSGEETDGV